MTDNLLIHLAALSILIKRFQRLELPFDEDL